MTLKALSISAGTLVLFLCAALCVSAKSPQAGADTAGRAIGTRLKAKGVPNFGQVDQTLYRGGQPSTEGIASLKKLGVNVVVDLRGSASKTEQAAAAKLGIQYVSIPSHCPFPKDEPFAKFLRVIRENPGKKVFVHCRLGDDRTGMAVAAYRMAQDGWSADEAMREMRTFGFTTVHHAMCPGLADYEEQFPKRLQSSQAFKDLPPRVPDTSK